VSAADVSPAIDSCDENMLPKINMLFDGEMMHMSSTMCMRRK
jgi:hypothetical protein